MDFRERLVGLLGRSTRGLWRVYDSNSFRRIGLADEYKEIIWPAIATDGHPDISGLNLYADLRLLMFLKNNALPVLAVITYAQLAMDSPRDGHEDALRLRLAVLNDWLARDK